MREPQTARTDYKSIVAAMNVIDDMCHAIAGANGDEPLFTASQLKDHRGVKVDPTSVDQCVEALKAAALVDGVAAELGSGRWSRAARLLDGTIGTYPPVGEAFGSGALLRVNEIVGEQASQRVLTLEGPTL